MQIERFSPDHALWNEYIAHMERQNMARWAVDENCQPKEPLHFLGAIEQNHVIGHISLKKQILVAPATEWSGGEVTPITRPDGSELHEMFVYTFAVDEDQRRRGVGQMLQLAALDLTRAAGCYQMRSWSSADHLANHALKISLGFSVHPAVQTTSSGLDVSGSYFTITV